MTKLGEKILIPLILVTFSQSLGAKGVIGGALEDIGNAVGGDVGKGISRVGTEGDKEMKKVNETIVNPAVDSAKDTVEATYRAAVLPIKATSEAGQAVLGQKSWSDASKEVSDSWTTTFQTAGDAISSAGKATYGADEALIKVPINVSREVAGKDAQKIVQNIMVPARWANALGLSATECAAIVVKGQDPKMLIAVPVAAAMRAARDHHYANSKPLPSYIKKRFEGLYPPEIIDKARFTVGDYEFTLPNALNKGTEIFQGSENASVMDDVIIFGRSPSENNDSDLHWWAHELHHVQQYHDWGVDKFAYIYINYPFENGWLERQADQKAEYVLAQLGVPLPSDVANLNYPNKNVSYLSSKHLGTISNSFTCTNGKLARQITTDAPSKDPDFACRVIYQSEKGLSIPWRAKNEVGYCQDKALSFVNQHVSWGWDCRQN
ncbi:hypothetical protein C1S99_08630 [Vibrio parahaemolyticus]|uniref:DUF4157 domain-containing protein n=2 Tax=Vibrio parahaemolyticus TaxID=670 RepID=UPI000C869002|nr:DUF4157 domain-containing protein [Vibrio parahaemolyticus]EHR0245125.1 DUF4157 domain-containing protein [Vibrio parahaemolyticus]EJB8687962.1 DUF4157 domain-containing protein [Vibrio parahaemolyticus]MBE4495271.1 DUF4157 domain-containing protein [Vibrio parahaemolyticus]PMS44435.1 hypothetical protein C1T12_03430 [Vibrio parahaemolyticus]PMS64824.1 hypothetical protein C1S91_03430 [Vibrio parahaemolyticus]